MKKIIIFKVIEIEPNLAEWGKRKRGYSVGLAVCAGAAWRQMGRLRGSLPGLDRGTSEDLSLQALKSDAVLWKTKGTGRGTNMVLCRPGGRWMFLLYSGLTTPFPAVVLWPSFSALLLRGLSQDAGKLWEVWWVFSVRESGLYISLSSDLVQQLDVWGWLWDKKVKLPVFLQTS